MLGDRRDRDEASTAIPPFWMAVRISIVTFVKFGPSNACTYGYAAGTVERKSMERWFGTIACVGR
jgi:hypothetical protein